MIAHGSALYFSGRATVSAFARLGTTSLKNRNRVSPGQILLTLALRLPKYGNLRTINVIQGFKFAWWGAA